MILSGQKFCATYKTGKKTRYLSIEKIFVARITKQTQWGSSYSAKKPPKQSKKPNQPHISLFPSTSCNNFHFTAPEELLPTSTAFYT